MGSHALAAATTTTSNRAERDMAPSASTPRKAGLSRTCARFQTGTDTAKGGPKISFRGSGPLPPPRRQSRRRDSPFPSPRSFSSLDAGDLGEKRRVRPIEGNDRDRLVLRVHDIR